MPDSEKHGLGRDARRLRSSAAFLDVTGRRSKADGVGAPRRAGGPQRSLGGVWPGAGLTPRASTRTDVVAAPMYCVESVISHRYLQRAVPVGTVTEIPPDAFAV